MVLLHLRRRVVILLTVIRYTWVITKKWYYPKAPCLNPLSPWVINFCHYLLYVLGGVYTRCIKKKKPNERDLYKMYQKEKTERAKAKFGSVLSHLTRRLGKTHTVSESTLRHAVSAKWTIDLKPDSFLMVFITILRTGFPLLHVSEAYAKSTWGQLGPWAGLLDVVYTQRSTVTLLSKALNFAKAKRTQYWRSVSTFHREKINVPVGESNAPHLPPRWLWHLPQNPKSVDYNNQKVLNPNRTPPRRIVMTPLLSHSQHRKRHELLQGQAASLGLVIDSGWLMLGSPLNYIGDSRIIMMARSE